MGVPGSDHVNQVGGKLARDMDNFGHLIARAEIAGIVKPGTSAAGVGEDDHRSCTSRP